VSFRLCQRKERKRPRFFSSINEKKGKEKKRSLNENVPAPRLPLFFLAGFSPVHGGAFLSRCETSKACFNARKKSSVKKRGGKPPPHPTSSAKNREEKREKETNPAIIPCLFCYSSAKS
jgi:hypothetical protein